MRSAFTTLEIAITIAIVAIIAAASIPTFRNYQMRSDLDLAEHLVREALNRATLLSQSGEDAATWGFHPLKMTLFQGEAYETRDASKDELYPLPPGVIVSGLPEVTFSKVYGEPSEEGHIVLVAVNGETRTISITSDGILGGGTSSSVSSSGEAWDVYRICHYPPGQQSDGHVINVPKSAWKAHQAHGDVFAPCPEDDDDDD